MSYISKVWCLIDILAEDPFKRYLSFFLASCMRSNLNILGSWIFNPVMGCSMFFFSLPYRKWWWSPKATEKMQGDYFHEVRHRIAGDATEFRRKQKVNLWELSQRSRHSRGGEPPNISVTNYFLDLGKSAVSISNLSFLPTTKWAWANQPISPASQKTTGAFGFFLGKSSFWLFHQL